MMKDSGRAQPAADAGSTGLQGKRPGEGEGCSGLSSLPCDGKWEKTGLCSEPRDGEVRSSSALLFRTDTAALSLLRTAATQSKEEKAPPPPGPQE